MDTFQIKSVCHRFCRNITGQIPHPGFPAAHGIHMAEQTVKHHMKIGPVYKHPASPVQITEVFPVIINNKAICSQPPAGRIHLKAETAE